MTLQQHPLSASWPNMSPEDFQSLRDSVGVSGLREPITLFAGQILDGWQRYQACIAEGVEPRFETFPSEDLQEAADFVRDKHTRRPMSLTQRLTSYALMAQACFRPNGVNSRSSSATVAEDVTVAQLASQAGSGVRTAASVKAAVTHGTPELVESMKRGEVPAHKAEQIARLPAEQQPEALAQATAPKPKKARFKGKPKRGPKADADRAALKAAMERDKAAPAEPEQGEAPPDYTALDAAHDQIAELQAALALANLGDVSEEDRNHAKELIESLQAEVKSLNAQLAAVTQSRDYLMAENAQMKHQMAAQRRELDRLKTPAT